MSHTPGPWKIHPYTVDEKFNQVKDIGPTGWAVANVIGPFERKWDDTAESNASLIAAAPDLLQTLVAILAMCTGTGNEADRIIAAACRAAIAKAEGKS